MISVEKERLLDMKAMPIARRDLLELGLLAMAIVAFNNLIGLAPHQAHGVLYVPVNLAFLAGAMLVVVRRAGLTRAHLGLEGRSFRKSAALGLAIGVLVPAPMFLLVAFPGLLGDEAAGARFGAAGRAELLYLATVRIPIGTALFEEMLFRGLLYGRVLVLSGHRAAILFGSAAFALWHIRPTLDLFGESELIAGALITSLAMVGAMAVTFAGGLLFGLLRYRTGHVAGGVLAHALINSLSAVAVYLRG